MNDSGANACGDNTGTFGCVDCHGRRDGTGTPQGYGLRLHHENSGFTCFSCHPNDLTPLTEDVPPYNYGCVDANVDNPCLDPNQPGTEDWSGDGEGLDNDGDTVYDMDDPTNCAASSCVDNDGDGYGDPGSPDCPSGPEQDCDDNDDQIWQTPDEVLMLLWLNKTDMEWQDLSIQAGPGTSYDIVQGSLTGLPVGASEVCLGNSLTNRFTDPTVVISGGYFYLARGTNRCAVGDGTYGFDSRGAERITAACP
jgi:hypothetical protein